MESHWETRTNAPMYLLQIPNFSGEGNLVEALPIPGLLSLLAFNDPDAEVLGLNDVPEEDRPPVMLTFLSFRLMVGLGTLFPLVAGIAFLLRNKPTSQPKFLKLLPWMIPLPYIAIFAGWTVTEVGRQPWIVYKLMRTADAVSPVVTSQVVFSFATLCLMYLLLGAVDIYLLVKYARQGPE